jgi:flagellar basal body-associated protein FliL
LSCQPGLHPEEEKAMPVSRRKLILIPIVLILVAIGLFAAYLAIALHWSFSKGDRAGYVQKFSHKGWLCKTWEGELQMVPVPGATPEKFAFTVRDDAIAQQLNNTVDKRVTLEYEQHKGLPTSCFGETEYFITAVKNIQ